MAYDTAFRRMVIFGGVDVRGRGLTDLWSFDTATGAWTPLAPECWGNGCPPATGHAMVPSPVQAWH